MNVADGVGCDQRDHIIWNPVERNWHLRAPWRATLPPADFASTACRFCPGGTEAVPSEGPHFIVSKYPFVAPPADGTYEPQRVLFFSRSHGRNLCDLTISELARVLVTLGEEASLLMTRDAVQSVYMFQAYGSHFGVSVAHPHVQVLALPFVATKHVMDCSDGCPLCVDDPWRHAIATTDDAVLAVPPWSRVPYEMVISPRRHVASLSDCDPDQVASLLQRALTACSRLMGEQGDTPYIVNFMAAPRAGGKLDPSHHFRIEILPYCTPAKRVRQLVAIEMGLGVVLNPLSPESASEALRELIGPANGGASS